MLPLFLFGMLWHVCYSPRNYISGWRPILPSTDRFIAETTLYVRYAETDAMGIIHHASYIIYFEEGRSNYARQRGSDYASFERSGYYLAVSEELNAPLWTADKRLANNAKQICVSWVYWLGDLE